MSIPVEIANILKACRIDGNSVFLPPGQLDRKVYTSVAQKLQGIGGKWNRKVGGFVFPATPDLEAAIEGRNPKKEFQFFPTPPDLADHLVGLVDIQDGDCILEPSAGHGALIRALHRKHPHAVVDFCEVQESCHEVLLKLDRVIHVGNDFLTADLETYDVILANPPFTKNQDILHIRRMYDLLKPQGRLVSLSSPHWSFAENRTCKDFRGWLEELGAEFHDIESGAFKESGTMINTRVIVMTKPL